MSADALEPVALGRRPHAGTLLAIWVVLLVAIPSALVVGPLGSAGSPAQLVGLVAGGWWLAYQVQRSRARLTPSEPTRTAMAVFAAAMIASYVAATSRPIEGIELSAADRGLLVILSLWGVTLLTTDGLVSRANLDSLLRLLVWLTAAAAAVGCLQFFTGATIVDRIDIPGLSANKDIIGSLDRNGFARVLGTSMHPIEFGMLLATVLPIALHYAARDTDRSRWKRYTPVVLICAALPLTMSRSAVLGVAVLLIVLFPTWSKRQRLLALGGVVVGTCVVYVAVPAWSARWSGCSPESPTTAARSRGPTPTRWRCSSCPVRRSPAEACRRSCRRTGSSTTSTSARWSGPGSSVWWRCSHSS